jgi:hypothetical protein
VARELELRGRVDLGDGTSARSFRRAVASRRGRVHGREGVALAVRGKLKIYATDEALAHRNARAAKPGPESGPDTVH